MKIASLISFKRGSIGILSNAVLIAGLMTAPLAHADIFIFNDLDIGVPTITQIGVNASITSNCQNEGCTTLISHVNGATTTTYPPELVAASEPGFPNLASDVIELFDNRGQKGQEVVFLSLDDANLPLCAAFVTNGICQLVEDGKVQTAATLTWSDGSTDTIQFQSRVSAVPLPASVWLFSSVLAGFGLFRKRA
jgi:hypothetical protein